VSITHTLSPQANDTQWPGALDLPSDSQISPTVQRIATAGI
jgi:hypothetical protein